MTSRDVAPAVPEQGPQQAGDRYEVVVIGGGQAGLAIGYYLEQQGRRFVILERGSAIAPAWRERWDSLVLFTPRRFDALPGMPFPGDPDTEPTRDEVVAYLERYAAQFDLPVELESDVRAVSEQQGRYVVGTADRTLSADHLVVATGPFQRPHVPAFGAELSVDVRQMHSTAYRRPGDLPAGTIVVVGGGNTGYQIAEELVATRTVYLAVGGRQTPLPRRLGGRHIFWWLDHLRLLDLNVATRLGERLSQRETLIGSSPRKSTRLGVHMKPRAVGVSDRSVRFADGSEVDADAVLWATGYRPDYEWLHVPVFDEHGVPRHQRGVTDQPGLYFLGLQWQWTRGSALIGWVKDDAAYIARQIARTRTAAA